MKHLLGLTWIVLHCRSAGAMGESTFKKGTYDPGINFDRNFTGIYFDPAGFLKYNGLSNNLDEAGMSSLVNKVYSQFDKIMVPFGRDSSSNHLVPEVVAQQNKGNSAMQVIILHRWKNSGSHSGRLEREIADNANDIFPGTVKAVLLEMKRAVGKPLQRYYEFRRHFTQTCENGSIQGHEYQVGIYLDMKECEVSSEEASIWEDVARYGYPDMVYLFQSVSTQNTVESVAGYVNVFTDAFSNCKKVVEKVVSSETEVGFISTWPDTGSEGRLKYSNLVEFWRMMNDWARGSGTSLFLLQAFDVSYHPEITMKTNGWWRLIPNASYTGPSDFLFQEKENLEDRKTGSEADGAGLNLGWLRKKLEVGTDKVGICFNPIALKKRVGNFSHDLEVIQTAQLKEVATIFSKMLISVETSNAGNSNLIPITVAMLNKNGSRLANRTVEVIMSFDQATGNYTMELANEANKLHPNTVTTLIYQQKLQANSLPVPADEIVNQMVEFTGGKPSYQFGTQLPLELCHDHEQLLPLLKRLHRYSFKIIYFSANVTPPNSKLGLERVFPQLTVTLETCKRKVEQYSMTLNGTVIEVGFVTGWPLVGDQDQDLESLVQFVHFWERMTEWAMKTNTTLFLANAFDAPDVVTDKSVAKYGWWRLDEELSKTGGGFTFKNKKEDALRYAEERVLKDTNLISKSFGLLHVTLITFVVAFTVVSVAAMTYYLKKRKSEYLTDAEITEFFNGGVSTAEDELVHNFNSAYNKTLELPETTFKIDEESSPLGSGEFGKVCRGTLQEERDKDLEEVAVKMVKVPCTRAALKGLIFEVKILSFLGSHPHIVELKGAYTARLKKSKIFVFLELCPLGSLKSYLKKFAPKEKNDGKENESLNGSLEEFKTEEEVGLDEVLAKDMLRWAGEIANGMEFIASKHVVHMDLAARNILLTADKRAKITDFGLSRRMANYLSYKKSPQEQEPLPWRSMAPESLRRMEFTEKSDVWAFGVTLWEMFSLGEEPYGGLEWHANFTSQLESGRLRLGEPTFNRNDMYSVMLRCWNSNPLKRPTFSELAKMLYQAPTPNSSNYSDHLDFDQRFSSSNNGSHSKRSIYVQTENKTTTLERPPFSMWCKRLLWSLTGIIIFGLAITVLFTIFQNPPKTPRRDVAVVPVSKSNTEDEDYSKIRNATRFEVYKTTTSSSLKPMIQHTKTGNAQIEEFILKLDEMRHLMDNKDGPFPKDSAHNTFLHRLLNNGTKITPTEVHELTKYLVANNITRVLETPGGNVSATPLHWAVYNFALKEATLSLCQTSCVNFNAVDDNRNSILAYAVDGQRGGEFLSKLINHGADWRRLGHQNRSQLHYAAEAGNVEALKIFLKLGLDINAADLHQNTPLHLAVQFGKGDGLEVVKFLIANGAEVNAKNDQLWTPLYGTAAVSKGTHLAQTLEVIKYLIEKKADVFSAAKLGRTFLHELLSNGTRLTPSQFHALCMLLVSKIHSKIFNVIGGKEMVTPLLFAVGHIEVDPATLSLLKENEVNFNAVDINEENAMFYAVRGKRTVRFLEYLSLQLDGDWRRLNKDGFSLLHSAAKWNNLGALKFFASKDLNINQADGSKRDTPLHIAAQFGNEALLEMVQFLVENGADVNSVNARERTSLHQLAVNNVASLEPILETIRYLVNNGANLNWKDTTGDTFLNLLSKRNISHTYSNVEVLESLLNRSLDINSVDASGNTYLHDVLLFGKNNILETVRFLIENGANVNASNYQRWTPIHAATLNSNIDKGRRLQVIQFLMEKKADVFSKSDDGRTFLHMLLTEGTKLTESELHSLTDYLVKKGYSNLFNVAENKKGATPFHWALQHIELKKETLKLLKANNVSFNLVNKDGDSVLYYSIFGNRSPGLLSSIINGGADPKHLNYKNWTLLHYAAKYCHLEAIEVFRDVGLDINAVDKFRDTPLHKVLHFGKIKVLATAKLLVANGADVNATNYRQMAPIFIVTLNKHIDIGTCLQIIKYLIEIRADVFLTSDDSRTFLHQLLSQGSKLTAGQLHSLTKFLIEKGYSQLFNVAEKRYGATPFHWALKETGLEEATLALFKETNVSFNLANKDGDSVLYYSILGNRSPTLISLLIRCGANPKHLNNEDFTLLHFAAKYGNIGVIKIFLEAGLDVNATNVFQDTPLHQALQFGKKRVMDTANLLVKHGADLNAVGYFQRTPINAVTVNGHIDMVTCLQVIKYLIDRNATLFAKSKSGRTFLHGLLADDTKLTASQLHDLTKYLIRKGHSKLFNVPVTHSGNGATPLHWAVKQIELEGATLSLLNESNVNFDALDVNENSILYCLTASL